MSSMEQIKEEETKFINSDGNNIYCKYWYPKEGRPPRAAILICHGFGEHCQYYQHLATTLCNEDYLTVAHDHVGHGLSDGDRVHLNRSSQYVDDILQHVNIVKQKYPGLPVFIVGHSMVLNYHQYYPMVRAPLNPGQGGLLAMKTALDSSGIFAGVILIGPALVIDPKVASPFMIFLGKGLARLMPQFHMNPINANDLTHDADLVKRYTEDPLVWHGGFKTRCGLYLLDMTKEVNERYHEVTFPLLLLHGTDDRICSVIGSQQLYDAARSKIKILKLFPDAFHQVHNETEGRREETEAAITSFIATVLNENTSQEVESQ